MLSSPLIVEVPLLSEVVQQSLCRAGLIEEHSGLVARHMVRAEAEGRTTHGLIWLPLYLQGLRDGMINPCPCLKVTQESEVKTIVNGNFGLGHVPAQRAVEYAIKNSESQSFGVGILQSCGHVGALAPYVTYAAQRGFMAFAFANGSPAVPAPGASQAVFGTNPLAYAAPSEPDPLVVDAGSADRSRGSIMEACFGKDAARASSGGASSNLLDDLKQPLSEKVQPHNDRKGFILGLMVELLAGVAGGGVLSSHIPFLTDRSQTHQYGFMVVVIRLNDYALSLIGELKATLLVSGGRVPGQGQFERLRHAETFGLSLSDTAAHALRVAKVPLPQLYSS